MTDEKKQYPLRIPQELYDRIQRLADDHKRSWNSEAEYALEVYARLIDSKLDNLQIESEAL